MGLATILSDKTHPAPPGHVETPERLRLVWPALETDKLRALWEPLPTLNYDLAELKKVHSTAYIDYLAAYSEAGVGYLDADTYLTPGSFSASCEVTWALLSGVEAALGRGPNVSLVLGRPPGHHAEADRGMGFCLVNHVAVAAQYALEASDIDRVAIVDFDVHHGNGTQHLFYDRSDVLYISLHQYPFYPGTGSELERGEGAGEGFTLNLPLPAGTGDAAYLKAFACEAMPALTAFDPDLILVSVGFDGHRDDPLGGFELSGAAFAETARQLRGVAAEVCDGRLVSLLEGGYSPEGNLEAITNYMKGLAGL